MSLSLNLGLSLSFPASDLPSEFVTELSSSSEKPRTRRIRPKRFLLSPLIFLYNILIPPVFRHKAKRVPSQLLHGPAVELCVH